VAQNTNIIMGTFGQIVISKDVYFKRDVVVNRKPLKL